MIIPQKEKAKATGRSPRISSDKVREIVQKKAYELYEKRGRKHGYVLDDWLEAERLFKTARKT